MGSTAPKILVALLVHLVLFALAGLLLYLVGGGQDALADQVRQNYADRPEAIEEIRNEAVWHLIAWCGAALAVSFLLAAAWLIGSQRVMPGAREEGEVHRGRWVALLLTALVGVPVTGWLEIWRLRVDFDLAASMLTICSIVTMIAVLLAFFLSTGLAVKTTMRFSVPMWWLLKSFRER